MRQAFERARVFQRQRPHRGRDPGRRRARSLDLAGRDAGDVGAELREFRQHEAVDAFADRGQQNHGGDADRDPQQRQEAAQPMGGDGA